METQETKTSLYSLSKMSEFRKSIAQMGTTVPNGNVVLDPTKMRREPRLDVESIIKTPHADKQSWRIYSRIFYGDSLYRRMLKYLSSMLYNHYMITPLVNDKKPNKKKLMNDYNAVLRTLDEDISVESFTSKVLLDLLIEGEAFYYLEEYKKGASVYFKPIKLPADYCRIIGTAGTPAINIFAVDLTSWNETNGLLRQLKDPAVQQKFETIIIDTADIAYDYCEKFICNQNSVDSIGKIPFGQGYTMVGKEFDECLRLIVQLNYGLVIISHAQDKTFTNEQGVEYNQIVPTLANKARLICQRMCDIIGYSRSVDTPDGLATKLFMRGTPRYVAGSRFKYTPDFIDFNYKDLVKAIGEAIDKQVAEDGEEFFTDERNNAYKNVQEELDLKDIPDYEAFTNKVLLDELRNKIIQNLIDNNTNNEIGLNLLDF